MTELTRLDGPAAAAVSDQLVAVYRAAMAAPPVFETELETGWFAHELAGEVSEAGFCWIAVHPDRRGEGSAAGCWSGCWPGPAPTGPG